MKAFLASITGGLVVWIAARSLPPEYDLFLPVVLCLAGLAAYPAFKSERVRSFKRWAAYWMLGAAVAILGRVMWG